MALYQLAHDAILRGLASSTGKPLEKWLEALADSGLSKSAYVPLLKLLRDQMRVPHEQANAIVYAYLNPSMIPADIRPAPADGAAAEANWDSEEGFSFESDDEVDTNTFFDDDDAEHEAA